MELGEEQQHLAALTEVPHTPLRAFLEPLHLILIVVPPEDEEPVPVLL